MAKADPKKAYRKATDAVVSQRVERVLRLRIDGAQLHDIRDYARQPEPPDTPWGVSDGQLKRYIQRADELLAEHQSGKRKLFIAGHLARTEALYARALAAADFRAALACLQDLAKMRRLYPDDKGLAKQVAELLKRLAELEGK